MGIFNGTHHVVRFQNGEVWHFSASQSKGIYYRCLVQNGIWEKPIDLIPNAQEDFSVKIDNADHLHLICRSETGELLYLFYNGDTWSRQVLSHYDPNRYILRYPVVIPIKNRIHILFAIGTTFNTGYWSLYHYYWDETDWHSKEVTRLTAGYRLSPFYVDLSEKHIHLAYRGLATNKYQVFYCRYHVEHNIWSTPENVTHSEADCNMPAILIRNDLLHLTWTTLTKNDLTVKYKNKSVRSLGKVEWSQEIQLNESGNASFPRLVWVEGKIWCVWCQTDTLFGSSTIDQGASWSVPADLPGRYGPNFHYIHYSTNRIREKQVFQLQWILGNVEKTLSLPLVKKYMELPEYNPTMPSLGWMNEVDDISRLGHTKKPMENTYSKTSPIDSKSPKTTLEDMNNRTVPRTVHKTVSVTGTGSSLENLLLNELDRQEELHYSFMSKLDEQSKVSDSVLDEGRQMLALIKQNNEILQILKKEVEHIKQDIRELKSRRLLQHLFHSR